MKLLNLVPIMLLMLGGEPMLKIAQREWQVPRDFPSIQAAIEAAQEGDTILIAPGLYREHLVIAKSLALQGAGPDTVLEGEPSENEPIVEEEEAEAASEGLKLELFIKFVGPRQIAPPAIVVRSGQVQIRGFQIRPRPVDQQYGPRLALRAGIVIEKGAEVLLEQMIIRDAFYGVVVKREASLTLRQSSLHNWYFGVEVQGTATVEESSIRNEDLYEHESSEYAISIGKGGRAFIRRNRISIFHVSAYDLPAHRIGDFGDTGVLVEGGEVELEGNQIFGDLHHAVSIFMGKALVRQNLLIYRDTGLKILSAEAVVEDNTILGMMSYGVGIQVAGDGYESRVLHSSGKVTVTQVPQAKATLRHNRVAQNGTGIEVSGAIAELFENEVYANKVGIRLTPWTRGEAEYIADPAKVEMTRNRIGQNEECGIIAQASPHSLYVAEGKEVYTFKGQLTGEENEIERNLGNDLCPADYPWPPGFRLGSPST